MKAAAWVLALGTGFGASWASAAPRPSGASAVVGVAADYNALFDTRGAQEGTGVNKAFKSAVVSKIPRKPSASVPSVSFNGLALKSVMFSDESGKIESALIAAVGKAQFSVKAALSDFALPGVAQALARAQQNGVAVQVIVDESRAPGGKPRSAALQQLSDSGAAVAYARGVRSSFAILDGRLLETGSFSWNPASDSDNYENALFRDDAELVAGYTEFWKWLFAQSKTAGHLQYLKETQASAPGARANVCGFSPGGALEDKIAAAAAAVGAGGELDVAVSSLGSQKIADALVAAKGRGASVRLVLDRQAKGQPLTNLLKQRRVDVKLVAGIGGRGSLRHAFGLFGGALLETGSFSYGASDEGVSDALYSSAPDDVKAYQAEFDYLYGLGQAL